jgi:signal peptidase I
MDTVAKSQAPPLHPMMVEARDRWVLGETAPLARRRHGSANAAFTLVVLAAALMWTFTLRPQSLGGPVDYVMVQGVSMVPTFHSGDLVLAWRQDSYRKGDVVAYRVPEGEVGAGSILLHRIVGGSAGSGFVVQGDNNPAPDDWRPRPADIVGKAHLRIPGGGRLFAFLHAPVPLASLATGIAVAFMVVPPRARSPRRPRHARSRRLPR